MIVTLLLLLQAAAPTVGDTIWVTRTVRVPAGARLRAADWQPAGDVELLGSSRVTHRGDSTEVAYPLVVWLPGSRSVAVPGPTILAPNGRVDSLPPETLTLLVSSVLPTSRADSALLPQPAADIVPRQERTVLPPLLLSLAAFALLLPVHLLWRRRGHSLPLPMSAAAPPPPLPRWADAGEYRAVLAVVMARLRGRIAALVPDAHSALDSEACLAVLRERRPAWPHAELADLVRALDEARFAPMTFTDALGLAQWAAQLEPRLDQGAA